MHQQPPAVTPTAQMAPSAFYPVHNRLARKRTVELELRQLIEWKFPGLRSKVIVKAAHDANSQVLEILRAQILNAEARQPISPTGSQGILFSLPAEIRARIWELCVVFYDSTASIFESMRPVIRISPGTNESSTPSFATESLAAVQPPITRVSRQIRQESVALFYSKNKFCVKFAQDYGKERETYCIGSRWLQDIGPQNSRYLKQVMWLFNEHKYKASRVQATLKWLKTAGVPTRVRGEIEQQLVLRL